MDVTEPAGNLLPSDADFIDQNLLDADADADLLVHDQSII